MNSYQTFWKYLEFALTTGEIAHPGAGKALGALRRLKAIEDGAMVDGTPAGQTGYLNGVEPWQALSDFVAHTYDGAKAPYWLLAAERGF